MHRHSLRPHLLIAIILLATSWAGSVCADTAAQPVELPTSSQPLQVSAISGRYIQGKDFYRISEFFTGNENKSGKIIERSQPDDRSGFYLIVNLRLLTRPLPHNGAFVLEYIHSDDRRPQSCIFPVIDAPTSAREAFLGLTGKECRGELILRNVER